MALSGQKRRTRDFAFVQSTEPYTAAHAPLIFRESLLALRDAVERGGALAVAEGDEAGDAQRAPAV